MAGQKRMSLVKRMMRLITVAPTFVSLIGHFMDLVGDEALEARRSIITIVFFIILGLAIFLTCWLCLNGMLYFYFESLLYTPITALFFIFLLNIFLLIIIGLITLKVKKKFSFPESRAFIRQLRHLE